MYKLLRAFKDAGYAVVLVVGRDFNPAEDWDLSGMAVYRVSSLVKYIDPLRDLRALRDLFRLFRRIRPYAVHTHLAKAGILGRWAAFLSGTPLILHTVHGPTFPAVYSSHRRFIYWFLELVMGRITDHFVFVGQELCNDYVNGGVCSMKSAVIVRTGRADAELDALEATDPADLRAIRRSFAGDDQFLMACVGRVVPEKQQNHAIRVLNHLRSSGVDAKLVVVGEGLLKEEKRYIHCLHDIVAELELERWVVFAGHREDAMKIMAASDVVLHTSKREGLPNVLVEAALVKKPVVTYAVSGARELIRDGVTGFIVDQGDVQGASDQLLFLQRHPEAAREMGLKAYRAVSAEYRESAMIRKKLAFYRNLFDRVRIPGPAQNPESRK